MKVNSTLVTELAICFIVFILLFVILGTLADVGTNTQVTDHTTTLVDGLEDDTLGLDPLGTDDDGNPYVLMYEYDEEGWSDNSEVINTISHGGVQSMFYNGNASTQWGSYIFLDEDGDEFCEHTDITRITWGIDFMVDTDTNEQVFYRLIDCEAADIVYIIVNDTMAIFYDGENTTLCSVLISDEDFYRAEVTFTYGSDTMVVSGQFLSQNITGLFTVPESSFSGEFNCSMLWMMMIQGCSIPDGWTNTTFDDLTLSYTVHAETTISSNLEDLPVLWSVVIGVIILAIVIGCLFLVISEARKKK